MDKYFAAYFDRDGKDIVSGVKRAISDYGMDRLMSGSVLVGLSGGADSVMLLIALLYLSEGLGFSMVAVHVNHMIRGKEADRDEEFSRALCERIGVEFISRRINVPKLAKDSSLGLEEAARSARYSTFEEIKQGRNDISAIAVAHNADDNLETVIINIMRGAGTRGASGIPPVRDSIIRPLIYIKKARIVEALSEMGVQFVTDSTNNSDDYTRNIVRHKIIPTLDLISSDPSRAAARMSMNLREDDDCLEDLASEFVKKYENKAVFADALRTLHPAILFRVLLRYAKGAGTRIERVHVNSIRELLLRGGDFSVSVIGGFFRCASGLCGFFGSGCDEVLPPVFDIPVKVGENVLTEYGAVFEIFENCQDFSANVYNISTQADIGSAIIIGDLRLRSRADGDRIYYGGMTRRLKRLFSDEGIPESCRDRIPLLADDKGVVWVPGFGARDDGGKGHLYVRISLTGDADNAFLLPVRKRKIKKGKKVT